MSMDVGENKTRNASYLSDADAARFWELVAIEVEDRRFIDMGNRRDRAT